MSENDKNEHEMEEKPPADEEKVIFVNNKKIPVKANYLTGKEILEKADFDPDKYDLFLVRGQKSELIRLDQKVYIKNDMHFNAIRRDVPYG